MVIPDLVLFVNGVPLVVMEAKSPSLLDVWRSQAVRQLRRYQEAGPEWHGSGAPELFHYNLLCVAHCGAAAAYATLGAPENAYFEWKSVLPYTEDEVQQRFRVEPQGQAQLIVGLLSPATLLDILRDYVVYEPERGQLVKKLPRYQQYRAVRAALDRLLSGRKPEERGGPRKSCNSHPSCLSSSRTRLPKTASRCSTGLSSASGSNPARAPWSIGFRCPRTPTDPTRPNWCWPSTGQYRLPSV